MARSKNYSSMTIGQLLWLERDGDTGAIAELDKRQKQRNPQFALAIDVAAATAKSGMQTAFVESADEAFTKFMVQTSTPEKPDA